MKSLVRSFLGLAVVATLGLLAGCGGGSSSTPSGLPLSVSLTTTATTIQAGQSADLTATVDYDPPQFKVGQYEHINFHLKDSASGRAIADLQTYLGAFGHTLIMSEDMADYVHSHPLDILAQPDEEGGPPQFLIPPGSDLEAIRGGPDVTFEGLMPRPGMYRAWTQFRRNNKIHTFAFTFRVTP